MNGTQTGSPWAVILGGSSGFGRATARKLGQQGMNLCIVHRDRRAALPDIEAEFDALRAGGISLVSCNTDATSPQRRQEVLQDLRAGMRPGDRVRLLLHSIAFGNLKPLTDSDNAPVLGEDDFAHTIHAMGTSLVGWTQELARAGVFADDARVLAMTSEGSRVAWHGYAAVSAAKATLEAAARSLALEFAPSGLRANIVQAGITDTPALRRIPGNERLRASAERRNPFHRLTTPKDVADVIYLLTTDEAAWINGAVIRVDGGEAIAGV